MNLMWPRPTQKLLTRAVQPKKKYIIYADGTLPHHARPKKCMQPKKAIITLYLTTHSYDDDKNIGGKQNKKELLIIMGIKKNYI